MTTFFHVTRAERLPSILDQGLRPAVGRRSRAADDHRPAVYVFPSAQAASDALATWLGEEYEPDADLVMLEVDVSCLELHWPKGPHEAVCFETVPPHCITGHRPVAPRQPLPELDGVHEVNEVNDVNEVNEISAPDGATEAKEAKEAARRESPRTQGSRPPGSSTNCTSTAPLSSD